MPEDNFRLAPFVDRLARRSVLSRAEQELILALPAREKRIQLNEDFVALGERVDHACYVVDGLVARFDQTASGERQITALHIAGDMPDLHSVVQPTSASALQALSPTTLLQVPHAALRDVAGAHPAIAEALWRDCMVDATIMAQWVVNLGSRDALARIAHLLCEMACRYKVVSDDGTATFRLAMTQADVADVAGLTPIHVNRTLQKLAAIGTTFRNRNVRIQDWGALVKAGEFDRAYLQEDLTAEERISIVH